MDAQQHAHASPHVAESQSLELSPEILARLKLEGQAKGGAGWFYWIAGLSLVNTIASVAGSTWGFVVGLGITQVFDAIGAQFGTIARVITMGLDVLVFAVFIAFGYFAHRRRGWSFVLGMVVYALDGLLLLAVREYVGAAFHAFALWGIFNGFKAVRVLAQQDRTKSPAPA